MTDISVSATTRRRAPSRLWLAGEHGADGDEIKPYVRLYSKREWRAMCEAAGFETVRLTVRQLYARTFPLLNKLRRFDRLLGWYVSGEFRKPLNA